MSASTAYTTCVLWIYLLYRYLYLTSFVLDVVVEFFERPGMELFLFWHPFSDVFQVFKGYNIYVLVFGLFDYIFRDPMQRVAGGAVFTFPHLLYGQMRRTCAFFPQLTPNLFIPFAFVVEF